MPLEPRDNSRCAVNFYNASNRRYPKCQIELDDPIVSKILQLLRTRKIDAASKLALENSKAYLKNDEDSIADLVCLLALHKSGELTGSTGQDILKQASEKYSYIPDVRVFHYHSKAEQGSLTKKDLDEFLKLTESRMLFTDAYSAMIGLLRQMHDGRAKRKGYLSKLTRSLSIIAIWRRTISPAEQILLAGRLKELAKYTVNVDWSEPFLVIFHKGK